MLLAKMANKVILVYQEKREKQGNKEYKEYRVLQENRVRQVGGHLA